MSTAIQNARNAAQEATVYGVGQCLRVVRGFFGVPAKYATAAQAWREARDRHPETDPKKIPRGAPVFWTGGTHGYGHVAIATGNGRCYSTDIERPGQVDHVDIAEIGYKWRLDLVGWTNDLNGVRVFDPQPKAVKKAAPAKKATGGTKYVHTPKGSK